MTSFTELSKTTGSAKKEGESPGPTGRRTKGGSILGAKARSYENPSKFPAATITSDCKLGFKQHIFIILQFWRSEV